MGRAVDQTDSSEPDPLLDPPPGGESDIEYTRELDADLQLELEAEPAVGLDDEISRAADDAAAREPTMVEKLSGLPWSMAGNSANMVFVKFTFFGSTFVLFLSTLGLSKSQIGFLLSLIPYFGLVALFASPFVERAGFKRSFLSFWALRQVATFGMLLTPWVNARFGLQATFVYITIVIIVFALCRAIGETAGMPWRQEYIPNSIRGKFAATDSMITTVASFIAVIISSQVIAYTTGLSGYLLLFAVGGAFGLLGVWFYSFIPGGVKPPSNAAKPSTLRNLSVALADRNFLLFLAGNSLIAMATGPLASFLPLFMEEQAGISTSNVILLQIGTLAGTLLFSFMWGWTSDRYGSKPVMLMSVFMRVLLPLLFLMTPRLAPWNLWFAMSVAFLQGAVDIGWLISSGRLLFVGVVPPAQKAPYMSLHFAWMGLVGGTSQLLGGRLVDLSGGLSGELWGFPVDPYTPLFMISAILPIFALIFFTAVRADANYGVGEFAGLFLRGNPFLAIRSLVSYQFARDEEDVLQVTARLGESKSPLTEDELLQALYDPRFHVRLEAVVSIPRMKPSPRLRQAMIEILYGTELALSAMAAWALGRMGDEQAIPALRAALASPYRSIRAQAVRALGALHDGEMKPLFLKQLQLEEDQGLKMAYASSLGRLGADEAVNDLLALLYDFRNEGARMEIGLDLARLHGDEYYYVHLMRQIRGDPGTVTAQAVNAFHKQLDKQSVLDEQSEVIMLQCSEALARGNLNEGARLFGELLDQLSLDDHLDATSVAIARECAARLRQFGDAHMEYLMLALHTVHTGWGNS